jgi:CheY-like chemotaxis protein
MAHSILILDDKERWIAEISYKLRDAGFNCHECLTGKEAIQAIKDDHKQKIKLVLTDELLLVEGDDDGERQQHQGKDVRNQIRKVRPEMKFIVISDLPFKQALEIDDPIQQINAGIQGAAEFTQEPNVVAFFNKITMEASASRQNEYSRLVKVVNDELGDPKPVGKPGVFIGIGLPRERFQAMVADMGHSNRTEIRLHEYLEHFEKSNGQIDRKKIIGQFLQQCGLSPDIRDFLADISKKKKKKEKGELLDQLSVKLDKVFLRKPNTSKLIHDNSVDITGSTFRVYAVLAWRSERGEAPRITSEDYSYQKREARIIEDLGLAGIGEDSLTQSQGGENSQESLDNIAGEIVYTGGSVTKGPRPSNPLKVAICRLNTELKEHNIGRFNLASTDLSNNDRDITTVYQPTFQTGIMLYPVDPD